MGLRTLVDTGAGPYRVQVRIEESYYKLLFVKSDWNRIQRGALVAGGQKFVNDYLPLRFQNYARAFLGYTGMKKKGLPLVITGRLREFVLTHARISATATTTRSKMIIDIPTPEMQNVKAGVRVGVARTYKANPLIEHVLSAVTDREAAVVENEAQAEMTRLIEGATTRTIQRGTTAGQQRMSLTTEQRHALPHAARSNHLHHQERAA